MPDDIKEVIPPEPYHLIISQSLFNSIKHNQGFKPDKALVLKEDAQEFEKFKVMFKTFLELLNKHDSSAFSMLSNIMGMWGYSRKYCGMCGKPIIGRPGHIENRMVCGRCNESFRITEQLYKSDVGAAPRSTPKPFPGRKPVAPKIATEDSENLTDVS